MKVSLVNTVEAVEALRPEWDALFERDHRAFAFQSWAFNRAWMEVSPYPWAMAIVRAGSSSTGPMVGGVPLSIRGATGALRIDQVREIHLGGSPGADYNALLIDPAHERAVVDALAMFIIERSWDRLRFQDVNDARMELLAESLRGRGVEVESGPGTGCPYIDLPSTWDEYLSKTLGYETRKSLRKKLKKADEETRLTVTSNEAGEAAIRAHVDALMSMALNRTREHMDENLHRAREPLVRCCAAGHAAVLLLWKGDEAVAGMGAFLDHRQSAFRTWVTGFDERFRDLSPGRVINALCIRHAIEQGYRTLDFLRGEEEYKMQFGAAVRHNTSFGATRSSLHTTARLAASSLRKKLGL